MSQNNTVNIEAHVLNKYTILQKIGSGAYGHVWKVEHNKTKKIYALKKIFDAFINVIDAQRTYRQATILSQLTHPNITKLYETIPAENKLDLYIIMEFVQTDLHEIISQNILKDAHRQYIIYQISKALKYLHSGYVIHRDLKPSNILINSNFQIKLCDFGLVRTLNHSQGPALTEGVVTKWYRAPEILIGQKNYSTPVDIWSFGCVIYQMIMGKSLFLGSSTINQLQKIFSFTGFPSDQDIQDCVHNEKAIKIIKSLKLLEKRTDQILKNVNPQFKSLLEKMLQFNPLKRITIDQILNLSMFEPFRNAQSQIICQRPIRTMINDNFKYSVEKYRESIHSAKRYSLQRTNKPSKSQKLPLQHTVPMKKQRQQLIIKYIKHKDFSGNKRKSTEDSQSTNKEKEIYYKDSLLNTKNSNIVKKICRKNLFRDKDSLM